MLWWILGLLGGGLVLSGLSSSDGEQSLFIYNPKESLLKTSPITEEQNKIVAENMNKKGYYWRSGYEKFRDPRIPRCFYSGNDNNPYEAAGDPMGWYNPSLIPEVSTYLNFPVVSQELMYLGAAKPNSHDRIKLLKERINSYPESDLDSLGPIKEKSDILLENSLQKASAEMKTSEGRKAIAEKMGIPVSSLEAVEKDFENKINTFTRKNLHVDVLSIFQYFKDELNTFLKETVKDISKQISSSLDTAKSELANLIPVAGQIWKVIVEADSALAKNKKEQWDYWLKYNLTIPFQQMNERGYPYPWHMNEIWPAFAPDIRGVISTHPDLKARLYLSAEQLGASFDFQWSLLMWYNMSISNKSLVIKWWTTAVSLMADPIVYKVFNGLGRTRGLFASDEQVLLVAAPIAIQNGYDPFQFAELLWGYCEGWAKPSLKSDSWQVDKIIPDTSKEVEVDGKTADVIVPGTANVVFGPDKYDEKAGKYRTSAKVMHCYADTPMNAWALNFAALTECAYALVDSLKETGQALAPVVDSSKPVILMGRI